MNFHYPFKNKLGWWNTNGDDIIVWNCLVTFFPSSLTLPKDSSAQGKYSPFFTFLCGRCSTWAAHLPPHQFEVSIMTYPVGRWGKELVLCGLAHSGSSSVLPACNESCAPAYVYVKLGVVQLCQQLGKLISGIQGSRITSLLGQKRKHGMWRSLWIANWYCNFHLSVHFLVCSNLRPRREGCYEVTS